MRFLPIRSRYGYLGEKFQHKVNLGTGYSLDRRFEIMEELEDCEWEGDYSCEFDDSKHGPFESELVFYFSHLTSATLFKLTYC